jgi:hypothetical protein
MYFKGIQCCISQYIFSCILQVFSIVYLSIFFLYLKGIQCCISQYIFSCILQGFSIVYLSIFFLVFYRYSVLYISVYLFLYFTGIQYCISKYIFFYYFTGIQYCISEYSPCIRYVTVSHDPSKRSCRGLECNNISMVFISL